MRIGVGMVWMGLDRFDSRVEKCVDLARSSLLAHTNGNRRATVQQVESSDLA